MSDRTRIELANPLPEGLEVYVSTVDVSSGQFVKVLPRAVVWTYHGEEIPAERAWELIGETALSEEAARRIAVARAAGVGYLCGAPASHVRHMPDSAMR